MNQDIENNMNNDIENNMNKKVDIKKNNRYINYIILTFIIIIVYAATFPSGHKYNNTNTTIIK